MENIYEDSTKNSAPEAHKFLTYGLTLHASHKAHSTYHCNVFEHQYWLSWCVFFFFFSGVADSVFHLHSRSLLNFAYISPSENKTNVCTGYICSQYLLYVLMPKFSLFRPQKFRLVQLTQRCKFKHFLHSCWKILETLHCMYNNKKSLNAALNGATMVQLIGIYM